MKKFARILLAILSFAVIALFILYLFIPSMRLNDGASAFGIGFILFILTLFGGAILLDLAGME